MEHVENERAEDGKRRQYGEHIQGCVPRLTTEFFLGQVGGKGGEAGHCADRLMIGNKANKAIEKTAMSALTFHKRNATGCLSQRENYIECRARQCPMAM